MVGSAFVEDFSFLIFPSSTREVLGGLETLSEDLESMIHTGSRDKPVGVSSRRIASEVLEGNERSVDGVKGGS